MSDDSKELSRVEDILSGEDYLPKKPMSRVEELLMDGAMVPKVDDTDNGKVLKVIDGEWQPGEDVSGDNLPPVSSLDNGKVLKVVSGEWNIGDDKSESSFVYISSSYPFGGSKVALPANINSVLIANYTSSPKVPTFLVTSNNIIFEPKEVDISAGTTPSVHIRWGRMYSTFDSATREQDIYNDSLSYNTQNQTTEASYFKTKAIQTIPPVDIPDSGKVMQVGNGGTWQANYLPEVDGVPQVTSSDVGKVLKATDENTYGWEDAPDPSLEGTASGSIASFTDGSTLPMKKLEVAIEPQQDLHGYDNPWVGGSGKNKLPLTVDRIKANNTNGTWNGNVYTESGVTFTLETNEGGNITGIKVNGTASANVYLMLSQNELNYITFDGSYVVSGCSNGSSTTYALQVYSNESSGVRIDNFNEGNYIQSSNSSYTVKSVILVIRSGYTASNLMFKPMIRLASVTDATFAPYSNICPISGWDECNVSVVGKNLLNVNSPNVKLGYYINSRTGEEMVSSSGAWDLGYYIKCMPNTSYYLSGSSGNVDICFFDKYKNYISGVETYGGITTPNNCFYIRHDYRKTEKDAIQLEVGTTATTYEPYNGHTYTIDLDGTRYGGTLDVVSGVLTVDRGYVDLGDLNWTLESGIFRLNESIGAKLTTNTSAVANMLCSIYKTVSQNAMGSTSTDHCIAGLNWSNGVRVKDSDYTDTTSFKTAMNGVQLVYELATPQTIQLTPTEVKSLLATNNVFADTGDILDAIYYRQNAEEVADIVEITSPKELPAVTSSDNGKVLKVVEGAWAAGADEGGSEAVYKTLAEYKALTTSEKEDPTKIYFVINEGTKVSPTLAADDGNVAASSSKDGYYAWKAFSGSSRTDAQDWEYAWESWGRNDGEWISYTFSTTQIFSKVSVRTATMQARTMNYYVEGSNDGTNWTNLIPNGIDHVSVYQPAYDWQSSVFNYVTTEILLDTTKGRFSKIRFRTDSSIAYPYSSDSFVVANFDIYAAAASNKPAIYYKNVLYTPDELPTTSTSDAGKILAVNADGLWDKATNNGIIPVRLSKAAYDALTPAQKADESKLYLIDGSIITDETLISPDDLAADDGNVISSGGSMYGDTNRQPWTCFDAYDITSGSYNNYWTPAQNGTPVIGYHFTDKPHKITKVKIRLISNQGDTTNSVYVEGSNDGTNWIDISKNGGTTAVAVTEAEGYHDHEIETSFDTAYSYVRIRFASAVNVSYSGKFVGLDAVKIYATETAKVYNAICYNGDEFASLDPQHYFKEISQTDYDNLPDTKNSDGIIYFING